MINRTLTFLQILTDTKLPHHEITCNFLLTQVKGLSQSLWVRISLETLDVLCSGCMSPAVHCSSGRVGEMQKGRKLMMKKKRKMMMMRITPTFG